MSTAMDMVLRYGYVALFAYVLVSQLGTPLPSAPLMLAAGALVATKRLALAPTMMAIVLAGLCADSVWYGLGRTRGGSVVRILCRISLEATACARRADGAIRRHGPRFLLVAKYLPGLRLMVPPVVGHAQVGFARFIAYDAAGIALWGATYIGLGRFVSAAVGELALRAALAAPLGGMLMLIGMLVAVGALLVRRRRYGRAALRIEASELKRRIERGEAPCIIERLHVLPQHPQRWNARRVLMRAPRHIGDAQRVTVPGRRPRRRRPSATPPSLTSLAWYQVLSCGSPSGGGHDARLLHGCGGAALCMQSGGGSRRSRPAHVARRA